MLEDLPYLSELRVVGAALMIVGFSILAGVVLTRSSFATSGRPALGVAFGAAALSGVAVLVWPSVAVALWCIAGTMAVAVAILSFRSFGSTEGVAARPISRNDHFATQSFTHILNAADICVMTDGPDLRCRWIINPPLGRKPEAIIGRTDREVLPGDAANYLSEIKQSVLTSGEPASGEVELSAPGRPRAWFRIHTIPLMSTAENIDGVVSVLVNFTEEHRRAATLEQVTQALAEANQRFDATLEGSNITMYRQDTDLRYTWVYNPPQGTKVEDFLGYSDSDVLSEQSLRLVQAPKMRVIETGVPTRLESSMRINGKLRWFDIRVDPLFERGRTTGVNCMAIDITERKEYEQQLRFVMRELTHRSKNLLTVVLGIARQTAQTVDTLPVFVERFGARLQALARAHDVLADESWRGASIEELVDTQLGHVMAKADERVDARGEAGMLSPEAAQNVALALHELATNATKYGAFANANGRVTVRWGRSSIDDSLFEITWRETGGPVVSQPIRKGFGRTMIERLVPRAIEGSSDLRFLPGGIEWTLRFPKTYIVSAE